MVLAAKIGIYSELSNKNNHKNAKSKETHRGGIAIKEISAESVRDKSIRHGHISTLHLWWARRPLPVCRAIVFASLVPDPLDDNCPEAFNYAVEMLLNTGLGKLHYKPYTIIPYTSNAKGMEDNRRNRLMMFIGKFSDKCQENMKAGKSTTPKEQLDDWSLIKWENKNNPKILRIARELIFVAYQSDKRPDASWEQLHVEFNQLYDAIPQAEEQLYSILNRHIETEKVKQAEAALQSAIESFQNEMPSVFDPFAGGGAIPLEAARLGCRSYGNDINPVAHIIERGSAEFPQKYGKPIVYSDEEFISRYGEKGIEMVQETDRNIIHDKDGYHIPNRLAFDVEYCAKKILAETEKEVGYLYPADDKGKKPIAYYWARTGKCSNPACGAEVPLLKGFYLCKTAKKKYYLDPIIEKNKVSFKISKGEINTKPFLKGRECSLTCPCCGNVTSVNNLKIQFNSNQSKEIPLAAIFEGDNGKEYRVLTNSEQKQLSIRYDDVLQISSKMQVGNNRNFNTPGWGVDDYGKIYSNRQLFILKRLLNSIDVFSNGLDDSGYSNCLRVFIAIWMNRVAMVNTSFGFWEIGAEKLQRIMGRQALAMTFEYPESNMFCGQSGSAENQLDWILRYFESECNNPFSACFANSSSGDNTQFSPKSLTAVVTDPPYYDAIAYADLADFFYMWLQKLLGKTYPLIFATPQTPKVEECTALKHHHNNDEQAAKMHFETKLTQIFDAIESQTSDIVSIMYAHQSTEAWTTLCNSILGARMNITGSWPMDTEMQGALKSDMSYLESSVTVSCRPSERKGFADYGDVKNEIRQLVKFEVEKLYGLGFRGADLLTACFGQAVSVFGHYKLVETAEGEPVSVGQLLEFARESAAQALLEGVPGEPQTKFYCGWLQMNGMAECDFDDVNKYTRVGVNVEIRSLQSDRLLITEGNKQHLATASEHLGKNENWGTLPTDYLISQAHRMMMAYHMGNQVQLLHLVRDLCPQSDAPLWRLLDFLSGHLPEGNDLTDVRGILSSAEMLRQKCKEAAQHQEGSLDFGE